MWPGAYQNHSNVNMLPLQDAGTLSLIIGASSLSPFDSITKSSSKQRPRKYVKHNKGYCHRIHGKCITGSSRMSCGLGHMTNG